MQNKLAIQKFIEEHENWEILLKSKPYSLKMNRDTFLNRKLILFQYNMIESNFNEQIVRESRGLILDEDTKEVISYPFNKFGNYQEGPWVDEIDWKTAKVGTKIDGSIIKIVRFDEKLLISTNGTIDANKAKISSKVVGCNFKSYGELVHFCLNKVYEKFGIDFKIFKENYTYIMELVSPWTRVVIPYKETKLYLIGIRNNTTFQEHYFKEDELAKYFDTPQEFSLKTVDECLKASKNLPWDEEGYVVVDANFHRNKIKSPAWVACHHLKGNDNMTLIRGLEIARTNEISEVLNYFPEFKDSLENIKKKYDDFIANYEETWNEFLKVENTLQTRKDKAMWIKSNFKNTVIAFQLLDKKVKNVSEYTKNVQVEKLAKFLGLDKKENDEI